MVSNARASGTNSAGNRLCNARTESGSDQDGIVLIDDKGQACHMASTKARVVEAAGKTLLKAPGPLDAWWTSCLEQHRPPFALIGLSFRGWDLSKHSTRFTRAGWKARRSSRREAVGDALLQSKY
jgi:hypothetical protein